MSEVDSQSHDRAAEATRAREAEQKRFNLQLRVNSLTARQLAELAGGAIGIKPSLIAARVVEISREDWLAVVMGADAQEAA